LALEVQRAGLPGQPGALPFDGFIFFYGGIDVIRLLKRLKNGPPLWPRNKSAAK
jgi:hypothetical protein